MRMKHSVTKHQYKYVGAGRWQTFIVHQLIAWPVLINIGSDKFKIILLPLLYSLYYPYWSFPVILVFDWHRNVLARFK